MAYPRFFSSDNIATVHPRVMEALGAANRNHAPSYGSDQASARVDELFRAEFGPESRSLLVWNGTGANVLALAMVLRPGDGVICPEHSHLVQDEAGAPERLAGVKFLTVPTTGGKILPRDILQKLAEGRGFHSAIPRMVSISQASEYGTVYSPDEVDTLAEVCRHHGLWFHVDGSRLANAAVHLGCTLAQAAGGADLISLGGTKNGLMYGDALVLGPRVKTDNIHGVQKSLLQLASKQRFIAAQYEVYLGQGLWKECAQEANRRALELARMLAAHGLMPEYPVQSNAVFLTMDQKFAATLAEALPFGLFDPRRMLYRLMCSWDSSNQDIQTLEAAIRAVRR